ncbi:MAG TPA: hypothetical protein PKH14_13915, partial [Syntrophorhabdus sp.]|nr:hypothetical protein [Syntrophorhabdus sp.]
MSATGALTVSAHSIMVIRMALSILSKVSYGAQIQYRHSHNPLYLYFGALLPGKNVEFASTAP